jgi:hypothetical protein
MKMALEAYKCTVLTAIAVCLLAGTQRVRGTVNLGGALNPVEVKGKVDVGAIENAVTTRGVVYIDNDAVHRIPVRGSVDVDNSVSVRGNVDVDNKGFG